MLSATWLIGGPDDDRCTDSNSPCVFSDALWDLTNEYVERELLKRWENSILGLGATGGGSRNCRPWVLILFERLEPLQLKDTALSFLDIHLVIGEDREHFLQLFCDHALKEGKDILLSTIYNLREKCLVKPWLLGSKELFTEEIFKSILGGENIINQVLEQAQGVHKTLVASLGDIIRFKDEPEEVLGRLTVEEIKKLIPLAQLHFRSNIANQPVLADDVGPDPSPLPVMSQAEAPPLLQDFARSFSQFEYANSASPHLEHFDSFAAISEFLLQKALKYLKNEDQFLGVLWMARELKDRWQKKECHYEWFFLFMARFNNLLSNNKPSRPEHSFLLAHYQEGVKRGQCAYWRHDDFLRFSLSTASQSTKNLPSARSFIGQFPSLVCLPVTQD